MPSLAGRPVSGRGPAVFKPRRQRCPRGMECGPGTGASHLMDGTSASGHR